MKMDSNYDVLVVGAGAAGLTAAIGLVKAGFTVAVVEAAPYPGAENWSGCVYFTENLARPEILGSEGVEALAWERRLVERGFFACDGYGLLGMKYRDAEAFRPERWLDGLEARLPKGAYFPFGDGPRRCIGQGFALLDTYLALDTVALHGLITVDETGNVTEVGGQIELGNLRLALGGDDAGKNPVASGVLPS